MLNVYRKLKLCKSNEKQNYFSYQHFLDNTIGKKKKKKKNTQTKNAFYGTIYIALFWDEYLCLLIHLPISSSVCDAYDNFQNNGYTFIEKL